MLRCPRRFATTLLLALVLGRAETRSLTILHTNDLHARLLPLEDGRGGFAYLAAAIRHEREGCGSCILLNAGDLVQGSPVSTIYRGLPVYQIANLLGIDVSTVGNHDFDYGWQRLQRFMKTARYPTVSANVVDGSGKLLARKPYLIRKINGLRLAVIGAETEQLDSLTTPALLGPWHTTPLLAAVHRYAAEVRGKSDLIVLLAHVTENEEAELLRAAPEIGVLVTGHAHRGLPQAVEREGRVLVRVKAYTEELGRLDLQVDKEKKAIVSWKWKRVGVDSKSLAAAPDVAKQVAHWEAEVSKVVDTPVAESRHAFTKAEVKGLIEAAMRDRLHADFAFMNAGGVRDVVPGGRVLARHIWNIMPFDNVVVVGKFKGNRLPAVVTGGHPVDPEREYTLAVSDFTAANQGAPTELRTRGLEFSPSGLLLRDVLLDFVKAKKVLD